MNEITMIVFILLSAGYGMYMHKQGIREGAARTVNKLHEMKVICYDNEGNIKPNPFFQEV